MPEDCVPELLSEGDVLAYQGEDTSEEQIVEEAVCSKLPSSVKVKVHYGHTLYHRDDLGFDLKEALPIPFGKFKFGICDNVDVRKEFALPRSGCLPAPPCFDFSKIMKLVPLDATAIQQVMGCGTVPGLTDSEQCAAIVWKQGTEIGFAMFDPWEQGKQYDKTESYVRRWLPELRFVPEGFAHRPHELTESDRARAGCSDYPAPLALEPFKYANDLQHTQPQCKQRKVNTHSKASLYGSAANPSARWQRDRRGKDALCASVRSNGRRWQAKTQPT